MRNTCPYSANDVIGRNCYVEVYHRGINDGWRIDPGHFYADVSMIKNPVGLPINVKKPLGPYLPSSRDPVGAARSVSVRRAFDGGRPNRPTGIDISCWSGERIGGWRNNSWFKWVWNSPVTLGQFRRRR